MPIPEHQQFPKIPRFNREIIITEKIDGTNAVIHIDEDGLVLAGSRKRWITPENDNFGFAAWVQEHEDELQELGPGFHYGEWWGYGIQRGYGLDHKRFSLFNVQRWRSSHSIIEYPLNELLPDRVLAPYCCHVVPVLYTLTSPDAIQCAGVLNLLSEHGSHAASDFMKPEGIVIYHTSARQLFKMTIENDEPKGADQ